MPRPSRDDVARKANVSGATVSRVFSGRTDLSISPEARARVLDAAQEIGYMPNAAARALMKGETRLIGLWMSLEYSRYRSQVVDRMRQIMAHTDYALAIADVDEAMFDRRSLDRALRAPVDGTLAFDVPSAGDFFVSSARGAGATAPFLGMGAFWSPSTAFVGVDLRAGADEAMRHLLETGRRRIAHLFPLTPDGRLTEPRGAAYCEALREAGLEPILIQTHDHTHRSAMNRVQEHLRSHKPPDAIFCFNDDLALGAYRAIHNCGLRIGEDVAIVGCDGIEETEQVAVPITTIRQPMEEMCFLAWQYLQERMEDPGAPLRQKVLKPELVIRKSSLG